MNDYVVLLWESDSLPADPPIAFTCQADDTEHAEEQAENAYADCGIAWVYEGNNVGAAFDDYYTSGIWDEEIEQ